MPITHSDTDLSTLRINNFDTLADYRAAYQAGYIDGNEISFIDEDLQADWNQSDPNEPDYIKNKPILSTVATSGNYNDLGGTPVIPTVYSGSSAPTANIGTDGDIYIQTI